MTRPKLILPPGAMPWGRWVEQNVDDVTNAIRIQEDDASSSGSAFTARSDLIQRQIANTPSVAAIYEQSLLPFSVTRSLNPSAVAYVYESAPRTFNPPRPDKGYGYTVIANMVASGTLMTFARSLIRVNGVDNTYQHENTQPGFDALGTFSIVGSGTIDPGQNVTAQLAVIASAAGTVTFSRAAMFCTFSGSIL